MAKLQDDCFSIGDDLLPFVDGLNILKSRAQVVVGTQTISLNDALGRTLAQNVIAPLNVPPHDNSAVDGYAVCFADLNSGKETCLRVTARIAAGHPLDRAIVPGEAMQIFTGAPVPPGMDTVFMQEDVTVTGDEVSLPAGIKKGANYRNLGEDVQKNDVLMEVGTHLRAQEIGLLASLGLGSIEVFAQLRAAIFSTGDEVADPVNGSSKPGAIFDANRYSIAALLRGLGCTVTDLGILPDNADDIRTALKNAAPDHDVMLTSGGVSLGEEDHITSVVESLGAMDFWRLAIKPGRPIALGRVMDTAFVGLPGNPVAAMVTFMRIARPLVLTLSGRKDVDPMIVKVIAGFSMTKKPGRREWLRVTLQSGADGQLRAVPYPKQGSGILTSMVASAGLVELVEEIEHVAEGDLVDFVSFGELSC